MIIHLRHGRLGNQIFEYISLKKKFPKEKLILLGMTEFKNLYDTKDINFFNGNGIIIYVLRNIAKYLEFFLSKTKIFCLVKQDKYSNILVIPGLINGIKFSLRDNYFQDINSLSEFSKLKIYKKHKTQINKRNIFSKKNKTNICVHIRRKDYLFWPSKKYSAVLPLKWYQKNINFFKKKISNAHFYLFSDDIDYLKKNFKGNNFTIINDNWLLEFVAISKCKHAIISASTFALFAVLSKDKSKIIIAPKYWIGHKKKTWRPKNLIINNFIYN